MDTDRLIRNIRLMDYEYSTGDITGANYRNQIITEILKTGE
jgi:hypothetical protein